jgi:divalent metal cation (Fe/Co/Zn/Cd) transporter
MALIFCLIDLCLMGTAAYNSNSVTILGDLLKETTDTLAVLAAFLTVRAVRKSPGYRFAYGVGKLENLVSVSIGVIMVVCAVSVTVHAVHHLKEPAAAEGTLPGIVVFALYSGIAFFISLRARAISRKQPSAIMESQAKLWFSKGAFDAAMGTGLTIALVFKEHSWSWYLDPLASLVGVCFMFHAAWGMASSSVGDSAEATSAVAEDRSARPIAASRSAARRCFAAVDVSHAVSSASRSHRTAVARWPVSRWLPRTSQATSAITARPLAPAIASSTGPRFGHGDGGAPGGGSRNEASTPRISGPLASEDQTRPTSASTNTAAG